MNNTIVVSIACIDTCYHHPQGMDQDFRRPRVLHCWCHQLQAKTGRIDKVMSLRANTNTHAKHTYGKHKHEASRALAHPGARGLQYIPSYLSSIEAQRRGENGANVDERTLTCVQIDLGDILAGCQSPQDSTQLGVRHCHACAGKVARDVPLSLFPLFPLFYSSKKNVADRAGEDDRGHAGSQNQGAAIWCGRVGFVCERGVLDVQDSGDWVW